VEEEIASILKVAQSRLKQQPPRTCADGLHRLRSKGRLGSTPPYAPAAGPFFRADEPLTAGQWPWDKRNSLLSWQ
jgi:hypothetical protein